MEKKEVGPFRELDATLVPEVWRNREVSYVIRLVADSPAIREALKAGGLDFLLDETTSLYREVFGGKPWEEYRVCSDGHKTGFSDVYSNDGCLARLEEECPIEQFPCTHEGCSLPTELFYPPDELTETFRRKFNCRIIATFAFQNHQKRLAAAALGFVTTLKDGYDDKVIMGTGDVSAEIKQDYVGYIEEAQNHFTSLGFPDVHENTPVFNSADWLVSKEDRGSGIASPVLREKYRAAKDVMGGNAPVIGHTLPGSKAHMVFTRIGFSSGETLFTGICRVYSTLDTLIEGIDKMRTKNKMPETLVPRHTDVIELTCPSPVGSGEEGKKAVITYLQRAAQLMGAEPLDVPAVHLSPLYGLSGWIPLEGAKAIHFYAWDNVGTPDSPFISVDISTPEHKVDVSTLSEYTGEYFDATCITHKTSEPSTGEWIELAPQIIRQRLNVTAQVKSPPSLEHIKQTLLELCLELNMVGISDPLIVEETEGNFSCWMHWETSGVVVNWDNQGRFSIDIYTCKEFDPQKAFDFLKEKLGIVKYVCRNF